MSMQHVSHGSPVVLPPLTQQRLKQSQQQQQQQPQSAVGDPLAATFDVIDPWRAGSYPRSSLRTHHHNTSQPAHAFTNTLLRSPEGDVLTSTGTLLPSRHRGYYGAPSNEAAAAAGGDDGGEKAKEEGGGEESPFARLRNENARRGTREVHFTRSVCSSSASNASRSRNPSVEAGAAGGERGGNMSNGAAAAAAAVVDGPLTMQPLSQMHGLTHQLPPLSLPEEENDEEEEGQHSVSSALSMDGVDRACRNETPVQFTNVEADTTTPSPPPQHVEDEEGDGDDEGGEGNRYEGAQYAEVHPAAAAAAAASAKQQQLSKANKNAVRNGALYCKMSSLSLIEAAQAHAELHDANKNNTNEQANPTPAVELRPTTAENELNRLAQEFEQRQARMASRTAQLRKDWTTPVPQLAATRKAISPNPPPVLAATTVAEIQERALAAEEFAKNQSKLRQASRKHAKQQQQQQQHNEQQQHQQHRPQRLRAGCGPQSVASENNNNNSNSNSCAEAAAGLAQDKASALVHHHHPSHSHKYTGVSASHASSAHETNGDTMKEKEGHHIAAGAKGHVNYNNDHDDENDDGEEDENSNSSLVSNNSLVENEEVEEGNGEESEKQPSVVMTDVPGSTAEHHMNYTGANMNSSLRPVSANTPQSGKVVTIVEDLPPPGSSHRNNTNSTTGRSPEPRALTVPPSRSASSTMLGRASSMCSSSVGRLTDGAKAIMEMLAGRPDILLPSPAETSVVRTGDVLSEKHVLKVDLQDALRKRRGTTGMISGAPYFRIVPKLNIAGVSQANVSAIRTIVNELRRAHIDGPVIWVNLREEPLVYINNVAHIVRERQDPLKPVIIPNVTGRGIEAMEAKLKQEVLREAEENGGNISVYVETFVSSGGGGEGGTIIEDQWESVDAQSVLTVEEVFRQLVRQSPGGLQVQYFRRPITQNVGPQPPDFDFILEACLEEPKAVFVFNCQTGRGRTSAMMQVANIVRFYQLCVKDVAVDVRVLRGNANTLTFRTIQKLVSLFPDGKLHERRLMILMDLADKGYSMIDHINAAFTATDIDPAVAKMRLQMYAYFLVFSYYCEQRLWNFATKLPFSQWLMEHPDLRLLILSVREKLDDQLNAERITAPAAEGAEAEIARRIRHRRGNVLSTGRILCSMPMSTPPASSSGEQVVVGGGGVGGVGESSGANMEEGQRTASGAGGRKGSMAALTVRQLAPDVPIFTCGRLTKLERQRLVQDIRDAFPQQGKIHWLSLRAEPMVVVNEVSYTLGEYSTPPATSESGMSMHLSIQAIEQMEDRLRRDVLLEAQENNGVIILHHINTRGERETLEVKVRSVRTPRSIMEEFVHETAVVYQRIPIPFSGQMLASDLDPLIRYLYESNIGQNDIIVINDSEGSTRTTVVLNIMTIYRAARLVDLRSIASTEDIVGVLRVGEPRGELVACAHMASNMPVAADEVPEQPVEVLLASTICQMLTAGSLLPVVDAVIALGGRGRHWNLLHALDYLKRRIVAVGSNKVKSTLAALHGLRSYLLVLLSALFVDDQGAYQTSEGFSAWVDSRAGVANIIHTLEARGEAALKYVPRDNLMKADLSRRCGDVLTANFCLKADHFPGCQKQGLRPALCGAPNFRKVDLVNVYGVAIPTLVGMSNVLTLLGAANEPMRTYPGQSNDAELFRGFAAPRLFDPTFKPEELQRPLRGSVVWVNLREEPILYVGDRPFVFRDLAAPYVNVELTGIQTEKIEQVENQLKVDVLNEADEYDGKFLVHDEGNPGELVGSWEVATEATVKTLREVYMELEAKGIRCRMLRLPVTDEQSPDITDFDHLVTALLPRIAEHLDRRETLSFVFNCQMGRGRTTTGMVICCMLIGVVMPEYYEELHHKYAPLYRDDESELGKGEYTVITQLKRVLTQGREAKYKVDLVLEACSKMQNLRTAIEQYAKAVASPDNTEEARARAHHAGVHYLVRYFNLIVFGVYLKEEYDRFGKRMRRKFVQWMESHPELTTLSSTAALK